MDSNTCTHEKRTYIDANVTSSMVCHECGVILHGCHHNWVLLYEGTEGCSNAECEWRRGVFTLVDSGKNNITQNKK